MLAETQKQIKIDLDQFKLHLHIEHKIQLSLHFDTPSRRFYLSVIALVVNEMKKNGRNASIPLEKHHGVLALLNESVGQGAGSSTRENLLPRIYKKWKSALPDLENAPLFRIPGRSKEYGEGIEKIYKFSDAEKDTWANLFDYSGSGENVRLRFSTDRIAVGLDDVEITFKNESDLRDPGTWDKYIEHLKQDLRNKHGSHEPSRAWLPLEPKPETRKHSRRRFPAKIVLAIAIVLVVGIVFTSVWYFYMRLPNVEPVPLHKMAFPLPERPSIAVLPFDNLSADSEQEYFSDGLTENIITELARVHNLFVISRESTFVYKGRNVKVQQVAEEMGVRYVLEGTVQRSANRLRITAQLIDAISGRHVWAEKYDRNLKEIFSILDEITHKVVIELAGKMAEGEMSRLERQATQSVEAQNYWLKAKSELRKFTMENNLKARELAQKALIHDPQYHLAYSMVAWTYALAAENGWGENPAQDLQIAEEMIQKAFEADPLALDAMNVSTFVYILKGQYDQAIDQGKRAIGEMPNFADAHAFLAYAFLYSGQPHEAVVEMMKAMRLAPYYPVHYLSCLGQAYFWAGRYEEAKIAVAKRLERDPGNVNCLVWLAVINSTMQNYKNANTAAGEVLKIEPNFSLAKWRIGLHYKNAATNDRIVAYARKAGLPD